MKLRVPSFSVIHKRIMMRQIIRWFLTLGFIALGLIYLNSTIFSTWAAGGPPTKHPHAWAQRALVHFGFCVSFIATGVMAFIGLRRDFNWRKSKYKYIWLILLLLSLGYPKAREWLLIDKCLDSGGAWSSEYFECKK
jgi:hypothetical protein